MPTPNAAALGKYTDIPVSYYTGVPNISIPLHTIEEGPLSLPISLSYHASGIKVGEPASWVGLGWSLSAGGMISRTVQGIEDEGLGVGNGGGYLESPPIPPDCNNNSQAYYMDFTDGIKDGEPDIFSFNFAGYSGKFYFNSLGEAVLIPLQDIKIQPIREGSSENELNRFVITTPDGVKYYFGQLEGTSLIAVDRTKTTAQNLTGPSAWYLRKIESHDNIHYIILDYTEEHYGYKNLRQKANYDLVASTVPNTNDLYTQFYANGMRLISISTSSGLENVQFIPESTDRKDLGNHYLYGSSKDVKALHSIDVQSGAFCKQYEFTYDYLEDTKNPYQQLGVSTEENKRLRLLSVKERSCNGSITDIPPYTFEYNEEIVNGKPYFPNRLSKAIDHWGFYNGVYTNNNLPTSQLNIPYIIDTAKMFIGNGNLYTGGGAYYDANGLACYPYSYAGTSDREPSEETVKLGVLNKIMYPTGGSHTFEYESNQYYGNETVDQIVDQTPVTNVSFPCTSVSFNIESSSFTIPDNDYLNKLKYDLYIYVNPSNVNCDGSNKTDLFLYNVTKSMNVGVPATWNGNSNDVTLGSFKELFDVDASNIDFGDTYKLIFYYPASQGYKTPLSFELSHIETINAPQGNTIAGGLRIKEIKANDGNSETMIKTYEYTDGLNSERSSGLLYNKPKYSFVYAQHGDQSQVSGTGCPLPPWQFTGNVNFVSIFFEYSVVPLSSFEGVDIGYSRVVEHSEGNGSKEILFYTEHMPYHTLQEDDFEQYDKYPEQGLQFPIAPPKARINAGNTFKTIIRDEGGNIKSTETNDIYPDSYDNSGSTDVMIKAIRRANGSYGEIMFNSYQLRTKPYRIETQAATLDGVLKTTTYEYNSSDHLQATKMSFNNSDGTIYSTEYKYAHEMQDAYMIGAWMINIPHEVKEFAGGAVIGGNKTFFNAGYPVSNEEILLGDVRLARGSTSGYTNGYPDDFTYMGFPTEDYNWLSGGRLNTRDFEAWNWDYDYHSNTRLLEKMKDIDGQDVDYEYDQLSRLSRVLARDNSVITEYSYQFGGGQNKVTSITTFTDDTPTQTVEEVFDGLGRMTKQIINGITKKEIIYDEHGRVGKETYLPGSFTTFQYEPSPLNRIERTIFPDNNFTETFYEGENNYYKVTVRNERGHRSSSLTDILGRQYKSIDAKDGETIYQYDERSNLLTVTPPAGEDYVYTYDIRNRMTSKKVPGSKIQIFKYFDDTDLLRYSIDANGNRLDYVYDDYGREVEVKHNFLGGWNPDNPNYYNNMSNHGSVGSLVIDNTYGEGSAIINTGKILQTKAKILGSQPSDFVVTDFTYDNYGRVSLQDEANPYGSDSYIYDYNLADWVLEEERTHEKTGNSSIDIITKRGYDNFGRELFYNTRIDGEPALLSVGRSYNEKDQVVGKYYAGLSQFNALNYAKYKYNVRGWLTDINDVTYDLLKYDECGEGYEPITENIEIEQEVNKEGLLEWLCEEGSNVLINVLDTCSVPQCFDYYYDYVVTYITESEYDNHVYIPTSTLTGIYVTTSNQPIPLNYPYYYHIPASMEALELDLKNLMNALGYVYDDIEVKVDVFGEVRPTYSISISIIGMKDVVFERVKETANNGDPLKDNYFNQYFNRALPCIRFEEEGEDPQHESLLDIKNYITSINPVNINFPYTVHQAHLEDSTSRWIPEDALPLLTGNYVKGRRLYIGSPSDVMNVEYQNNNTANLSVTALYQELASNIGRDLRDIDKDHSPGGDCLPPPPPCTPEQQQVQEESVAAIQNSICTMDIDDFECPLTITLVQLCDGSTIYIPGEELLNELEGPYIVLDDIELDADDIITISVTIPKPIFSMKFSDYQENGNIEEMRWKVTNHSVKQYSFTYDELDRVTSADYGYYEVSFPSNPPPGTNVAPFPNFVASDRYSVPSVSYDAVGNITGVVRNGMVDDGTGCLQPYEIDNLRMSYNPLTNHLLSVEDNAPNSGRPEGFKPGGAKGIVLPSYTYDDNGNMTYDPNKSISLSSYNFLNLPEQIGQMQITYDATGKKWKKIGQNGTTYYLNGIEYSGNNLESIYEPDGRILFDQQIGVGGEYRVEYFHQDHLGNNRLAFSDFNQNGLVEIEDDPNTTTNELEITQENHYYPFGMNQNGDWYATISPDNKYQYNNKELNTDWDINLYDYGARWYDPAIGRWSTVDALAESYYPWSTYNYTLGNPLVHTDPDGNSPARLAVTGVKIAWRAIKIYRKSGRVQGGVKRIIKEEGKGIGRDVKTIFGKGFNLGQRVKAIVDLVIGTDLVDIPDGSVTVDPPSIVKSEQDTDSETRSEAFNKAKDGVDVPRSATPDKVIKPDTPEGDEEGLDDRNKRLYEYTNSKGEKVRIREDKAAKYKDGGTQPPHFNAGKKGEKLKQHHNFKNKKNQ
jgi:RHS repeat-associated protein